MREELLNYRKDGSEYWIEICVDAIKNEANEITHFIAVERDISDLKKSM